MTELIVDSHDEFSKGRLLEADVDPNPVKQFGRWYEEAKRAQVGSLDSMTLATVGEDGSPSARIVYLRGFTDEGFVFFTNYLSRKGRELSGNPRAALVFFWHELERQVRIEGTVTRTSEAESDRYFETRPRASQLGAWTSEQSEPLDSRAQLEAEFQQIIARFPEPGPVTRPPHWGGFRVLPTSIEFWQGRPSRLHDRLLYTLDSRLHPSRRWILHRLAP